LWVSLANQHNFIFGLKAMINHAALHFCSAPDAGDVQIRPKWFRIDTQRNRVRKRAPLNLDLNGIAKGFGVDELARCL
jgi:hypothetical protein